MKKTALLAALIVFISSFAAAQDRIAVADMDRLFNEYHKKKAADAELRRQAESYKKYGDELDESLKKLQQEFKTLRDESLNIALSDIERENRRLAAQDKYRQMREKEEEIKSYGLEKQNIIRAKYEETRQQLIAEISAVVAKEAKARGVSLVLDSSGKTTNRISPVVYHGTESDITEAILKELNPDGKKETQNGKQ